MTRTPRTRSKGQGHQAAVLTAVLARHAAAAMGPNVLAVCCYVAVSSAARGASAPTEGGEGRGHIVAAGCLQLVLLANKAQHQFIIFIQVHRI